MMLQEAAAATSVELAIETSEEAISETSAGAAIDTSAEASPTDLSEAATVASGQDINCGQWDYFSKTLHGMV